ncbi:MULTISPECIES: hypothetical protein [unclassified Nostoc]|nr:hypothetical protein [Nostoc sp. DedQUE03]MDZ7971687.1 hypothetical protein [Nostoc sp. DedQUE03]MDZ8048223.1 hypothetical protein [Nostoc sp. DedQUE02]
MCTRRADRQQTVIDTRVDSVVRHPMYASGSGNVLSTTEGVA